MITYYWAQKESGQFFYSLHWIWLCDGSTNPEEIYSSIQEITDFVWACIFLVWEAKFILCSVQHYAFQI